MVALLSLRSYEHTVHNLCPVYSSVLIYRIFLYDVLRLSCFLPFSLPLKCWFCSIREFYGILFSPLSHDVIIQRKNQGSHLHLEINSDLLFRSLFCSPLILQYFHTFQVICMCFCLFSQVVIFILTELCYLHILSDFVKYSFCVSNFAVSSAILLWLFILSCRLK